VYLSIFIVQFDGLTENCCNSLLITFTFTTLIRTTLMTWRYESKEPIWKNTTNFI